MAVHITIRDVPTAVRNTLAARAAAEGKSMQEYLRSTLEALASRPTLSSWIEQVQARKSAAPTTLTATQILKARAADRR